jgi:hypothetical protein
MIVVLALLGAIVLTTPSIVYRTSSDGPMPLWGALIVSTGVILAGEFVLSVVGANGHGMVAVPAVLSFFILRLKAR